MNPDKLLVSPHIDELEMQVLDYKDNFEVFQKEKEQFELQKKTNLFDEKEQNEMELELEKKKSELATNRTALLTSIDTALLKQDIDQTQKQQIETSKKEITQRDPNSSGTWRDKFKKVANEVWKSPIGRTSIRVGGGLLAFFWLKSLFSIKKKEKESEEDKSQSEEQDTSNEQETDKESEDIKPEKWESKNKDEEDTTESEEKNTIDELDEQVDKVSETAQKATGMREKIQKIFN